jgi:hypothetical protein
LIELDAWEGGMDLRVEDVVEALCDLDLEGANVKKGTLGIVIEEKDSDPGYGPLIKWSSGGVCNVYDGDVRRVRHDEDVKTEL